MMNLEVQVRLLDRLSGPARDTDRALARIGKTATRLTERFAGLTRNVRGLSSAVRDLRAADSALGNATASGGRLRGVITGLGPAGRTAATGLGRFTSAAEKLTAASRKASGEVDKLHGTLNRQSAADGFVAAANAQMREMVKLQNKALKNMGLLSAGGGRVGRLGMRGTGHGGGGGLLPGLMVGLQPNGNALHGIYEQATSLEDAIVKMHLNGLSDSEISAVRAKAAQVAAMNKSTNPLSNINAIMEARLALGGDLDEALATAGEMSKLRTIVGMALGKDRAKSAEDGVYDMLRTGEIRGLINNPARRGALFQGMTAALIASNGRITPKQWHQTALYGRSATQGLSDNFENYRLPFLMQELQGGKGGPAGVALQALFRALPLAIGKTSNIAEWRKLGFVDESKVLKGKHGEDKSMLPGAITLGKLAISDPDQAVFRLLDAIKAHGMTDRGSIIQEFARLVGSGTGQSAVDILGLQRTRLDNFSRTLRQVEDTGTLFAQINQTASQSVTNLNAQMDALRGNIGSSVLPAFTSLVDGTRRFIGVMNSAASVPGKDGNDPVNGNSTLGLRDVATIGGGALYGIGALAKRFPWFGKLLAGGAGAAATGSPYGALLGPSIYSAVNRLTAALGRFAGGVTNSGSLGMLGMIAEWQGQDERLRFGAGRLAAMRRAVEDNPQQYGALRALAGHRALGGPVHRGLTYLVGERGPELFTPGATGGISTNAALGRMASGRSDDKTAKEIRFLSFALASSVDGISRSIDRLNARFGVGDDSDDGSGSGGNGSGSGTDSRISGGRKGFMSRGGHFGGRRGFVTRQFGTKHESLPGNTGPHVHLGQMHGGGRGRLAKFDSKAPAIMGGLMAKYGVTADQAAGVVGNLGHESARFTAYHEGGKEANKGGVGWAQWTGPRRRAFERWVSARHLNPTSDEASWRYLTEGDPETARAIAAVKRTHTADQSVRAFHDSFERSADISHGQIVKPRSWNDRLSLAHRAYGMKPVPGVMDKPGVPDAIASKARDKARQERQHADAIRQHVAKSGGGPIGPVTIHVHPHPNHDPQQIARAVHDKFNASVQSQLSDGAYA